MLVKTALARPPSVVLHGEVGDVVEIALPSDDRPTDRAGDGTNQYVGSLHGRPILAEFMLDLCGFACRYIVERCDSRPVECLKDLIRRQR